MTRLLAPLAGIAALLVGVLAFGDLGPNLVYYLTPTEAVEQRADFGGERRFRLAGTVAEGSVEAGPQTTSFVVTDGDTTVPVTHTGEPPDLFQVGIQVVVEGAWIGTAFASDTMLIQHDETYYPPEDEPGAAA
jgi:cytochrome c-type biogenesis protein CcmE